VDVGGFMREQVEGKLQNNIDAIRNIGELRCTTSRSFKYLLALSAAA